MLIDNIDFADLYRQQLARAKRTEKSPECWDNVAEKMAEKCDSAADGYLPQLLEKIDLQGAETLFDMGCGPGTVALALADKLRAVWGVDYSQGMLNVAARRATQRSASNIHWVRRAWEDDWDDLPRCDIVVASRSTITSDIRQSLAKLNQQARLRVYTTHLVKPSFLSPDILRVLGREAVELPCYIYALNVLYQMGIHARVDFIYGHNPLPTPQTFADFAATVKWNAGELTDRQMTRLEHWYQQQDACAISSTSRDWALISWDSVPCGALR